MSKLKSKKNKKHRLYYGRFLCREWNREHKGKEKVQKFDLYYMKVRNLANGRTSKPKKIKLWSHKMPRFRHQCEALT